MPIRRKRCMGLVVGLALLGACASPAPPPPLEQDILARDTYVIGHEDVLLLSVWQNGELSVTVPVRPDGMISAPLLGDIQAAGLTPEELKELLTKQWAEYVNNPDVTVVVTQINSKRIYVLGAVGRSGPQSLNQDMRVLDAISVAGGFIQFAQKDNVQILRRSDGGIVKYRFDYGAYLKGDAPGTNMLLQPGDTIVVPD